ncbi:hypothetical protein HGRIS_006141 [Hohenbuehelia grisea]|uniref:YEATS domain-containing protein n=1 Tax=Hohenbuehelia grisea TaxID=104357 RepID=A0ABR3K043_9AGAR
MPGSDSEPPRKKRKPDEISSECLTDIISEVDLEIALRERLAQTLQDRIAWARILQENVLKSEGALPQAETEAYHVAALEAWDAIHAPCDVMVDRELPRTRLSVERTQSATRTPLHPYEAPRKPPLRSTAQRSARVDMTTTSKPRFLYMRAPQTTGPTDMFYILKCPVCQRTTFTSLQGLLNHARIAHKLEWGTHDECIRGCAVLHDPESAGDDLPTSLERGLEISGGAAVLPSLQRMFQMAVGGDTQSLTFPSSTTLRDSKATEKPELPSKPDVIEQGSFPEDKVSEPGDHPVQQSTLISRTLGHHIDTPALAPFLGKTVRRKQIKVWCEDEDVDIDDCSSSRWENTLSRSRKIRRTGHKRSSPIEVDDTVITSALPHPSSQPVHAPGPETGDVLQDTPEVLETINPVAPAHSAQGSRFHMVARVVVSDRSWWTPSESRADEDQSHRWMILVEAPSYSMNLTTILNSICVSPAEFQPLQPSSDIHFELKCSEPPFVVIGTASHPFLARVELHFNPVSGKGDEHQKIVLEHWVELDPVKLPHPVTGEEQVVDVELDRQTLIGPARKDVFNIASRGIWDRSTILRGTSVDGPVGKMKTNKAVPEYEQVLRDLLPRFPMTMKDVQARTRSGYANVPYKLATSPTHLKSLPMGRRKAIEWGRASALRDVYVAEGQTRSSTLPSMSTGDVFEWLEDNGFFIRDTISIQETSLKKRSRRLPKEISDADALPDEWCARCGLLSRVHAYFAEVKAEEDTEEASCPFVGTDPWRSSLPVINIHDMIRPAESCSLPGFTPRRYNDKQGFGWRRKARDLVAAVDPAMILGVERVVRHLSLPTFISSQPQLPKGHPNHRPEDAESLTLSLDCLGPTKDDVDHALAPYAVLGAVLKRFVGDLVRGGLEVAKRDKDRAIQLLIESDHRAIKEEDASAGDVAATGDAGVDVPQSQTKRNAVRSVVTKGRRTIVSSSKMLTPGHILRGVVDRAFPSSMAGSSRLTAFERRHSGAEQAIYLSLAGVGIPLDHKTDSADTLPSRVVVKQEEDG